MESIILKKFELLPNHLKKEVGRFIDKLLTRSKKKKEDKNGLKDFFGVLNENDSEQFRESLQSSRKIDHDEW